MNQAVTQSASGPRRSISGRALVVTLSSVAGLALLTLLFWAAGLFAPAAAPAGDDAAAAASPSKATTAEWYSVVRRDFPIDILVSGELQAHQQTTIKSEVEGRASIVEIVDEGSFVKEGQVICRLASDDIVRRIEEETLNVDRGRADQVASEQALAIEINEGRASNSAAQVKLDLAELDLLKWRNGEVQQKQRELRLAVEKANRTLARAREDVELSKQLYAEQFISKGELDDDELAVIEAENALATARLAVEVYEKYTHPKEQRKFESDVEQARADLDRTQSRNQSELERARADLDAKSRSLKLREARLANLQRQYLATTVTAPQNGMVIYATSIGRRNGDPIALGREIRYNEPIIVLPDTRRMVAALKVHESLLNQVSVGQSVTVKIDAVPDQLFEGRVTVIGVTAEDPGWFNPDLRQYQVMVELPEKAEGELKPAMTCSGRILVGDVKNALAVPVQAVTAERKNHFVYVPREDGRVVRRRVTLGPSSETLAQITDGLSEGEKVLLRHPRPGEVADGN